MGKSKRISELLRWTLLIITLVNADGRSTGKQKNVLLLLGNVLNSIFYVILNVKSTLIISSSNINSYFISICKRYTCCGKLEGKRNYTF